MLRIKKAGKSQDICHKDVAAMHVKKDRIAMILILSTLSINYSQSAYQGYTFFASGKSAYLYDMNKNLIHTWKSEYTVSSNAVLLRDSSIYFPSQNTNGWASGGLLRGGRFEKIEWDGTVSWSFTYSGNSYCPHHNFEAIYYTDNPFETPNILAACYTLKGDKIVEIKPTGDNTADIVWEWSGSDHIGANNPLLLDSAMGGMKVEWMHTNYVSFHRALNQIVLSIKSFNEVMVIDHSTTTAEAAAHSGGVYGKGGDILYRWGNPSNYGAADSAQLSGQHSGSWIMDTFPGTSDTLPGRRNILIVNNGSDLAMEIKPDVNGFGNYVIKTGTSFAPDSALWSHDFNFQPNEGSVERLPNGNTLLCSGGVGTGISSSACRILEVSSQGDSVWGFSPATGTTRAMRYAYGYLGGNSTASKTNQTHLSIQPVKTTLTSKNGQIRICFDTEEHDFQLSLHSIDGRKIFQSEVIQNGNTPDLGNLSNGLYLAAISSGKNIFWKKFTIRH